MIKGAKTKSNKKIIKTKSRYYSFFIKAVGKQWTKTDGFIFLFAALIGQIVGKDVITTIVLIGGFFFFHHFRLSKSKSLKITFILFSGALISFAGYRIIPTLMPIDFISSIYNQTLEQPFITYKIDKLDLDSTRGLIKLKLRVVNISDIKTASNFIRSTVMKMDSVSQLDSTLSIDVLKRHMNEGTTITPKEVNIIPITLGQMIGPQNNVKYEYYDGVREYFKNVNFYILGSYSYLDNNKNRYVCMYCIYYDPWSDTQLLYSKFNYSIQVKW